MADSCLGSDATLSQPLIADPNQLPRYQRQEVFDVPWGWVSSCAEAAHSHVIPPSCCLLGTAKLIRLGPVLQSFHMFLISAENHSPDSCHLYIINEQRYHLFACSLSAPSHKRLFFFSSFFPFHSFFFSQSYLRVCGLPCQIGWVMKGYRKQPETWYWRHVIISDFKRACKLDFFFPIICAMTIISECLPFSLIPYLTS